MLIMSEPTYDINSTTPKYLADKAEPDKKMKIEEIQNLIPRVYFFDCM